MTRTAGDWILEERIARGSQTEVWRATHAHRAVAAAVKIQHHGTDLPTTVRRIASAAALDHPRIERLLDTGTMGRSSARAWMAFELLQGGTLAERADMLDWPTTAGVLAHVLDGLAFAHANGVLHRDVKPENVLFRTPVGWDAVLADFGLSWAQSGTIQPGASATPAFAPPEQIRGSIAQGPASDLYALGGLAWWCATGRPPFGDHDARIVAFAHMNAELPEFQPRFDVPAGFEGWVRGLLEKKPFARGLTHEARDGLAALRGRPRATTPRWSRPAREATTGGLVGLARPTLDAWRSEFDALLGALGSHRAFVLTGALDADRLAVQIELGRFVHEAGLAAPVVLPRAQDPVSTALARRLRVDLLTDDASIDDQLAHLGLDTSFDRALFGEAIEVLREQDHCPGARGLLRRLWTRTARERPLLVLTNSDDPAALAFARSLLRSGQAGLLVRSTGEAADGETELPLPALDLAGRERVLAGLAPLSGPTRSDLARECPAWPSAVADVLGRSMASLAWRGRELERASSATPALHGATETPARRALGVAALMAPFRVRAWRAAMTTLGDPRPDDALKVLVDGRLMAWRNGNFAVANEAIRREAVALADPADRGQWHRALADALQRFPFERGHHLVEAGAPSEAVDAVLSRDYARTPAPICIRQTDFCLPLLADDDARTGTCLESIAFAEIRFGLSTALQVSIDALASWNDRNPTLGRPFLLEILKGRVANMEGDRDAAITHLERARTMPVDDPYPVTIERSLGEVHIQSGNLLGAKTAFARAVEATFNPKTGVLSLLYLAWTNGALGDPARGLAQIEEVAHLTSATRRPTLHQIRGDLLRWNGQTDEAEREYRESMRWIEHLGHDTTATRFSLAHLDIARGRRPAIDADLDTIMESGGAWYRSAACAVALHLADLDPERAERALQRLERDGAYWDFDAVALLDAIAQSNRPEAARVQAVLDALKSASTAARR